MKIQTPMKRLKGQTETFEYNISHLDIQMAELEHRNEKIIDNKYNQYEEYPKKDLKEIESDFIRVFSSISNDISFAFKYTFLDEEKKIVLEEQYFEIIFKSNNIFESSKVYTASEAKILLKSINTTLKLKKDFTIEYLIKLLKDSCCFSEKELNINTNDFSEMFKSESESLVSEYSLEVNNFKNIENTINSGQDELKSYVENLPEYIELIKLRKRVAELDIFVNKERREKEATYKFGTLNSNKTVSKSNIKTIFNQINNMGFKINNVTRIPIKKMKSLIDKMINKTEL
jgi:hypothetical protein